MHAAGVADRNLWRSLQLIWGGPLTMEVTVRIMTLGTALLTATALALSASAQSTPTAPAITRTIVAATKLPSVVETPLHFKAMRVALQPGEIGPLTDITLVQA